MKYQPSDNEIHHAFESGTLMWPGADRVRDVEVDEDALVELRSGRRRFWAIHQTGFNDEGAPRVGDLVAFYVAGRAYSVTVYVITLLWTHDGIAPGWLIASLQTARFKIGE